MRKKCACPLTTVELTACAVSSLSAVLARLTCQAERDEIRARVDMMKGEATFFVNGQEVPHKARGITAAVRPCVLSYSSNRVQLELLH